MNDRATKTLQFVLLVASVAGIVITALNYVMFKQQAPLIEQISIIKQAQASDKQTYETGFRHVSASLDKIESSIEKINIKLDKIGGW